MTTTILSPQLRPPQDFHLPAGYRQQSAAYTHDDLHVEGQPEYWNAERIAAAAKYQHHVYAWGADLIREHRLGSVVDIGCGPAVKLKSLISPVCADIEGVDQASGIAAATRLGTPGVLTIADLERPDASLPRRTYDLVICADVLEHLIDPDHAMALIRRCAHERTLILLSTPDRDRLRGRSCMASPKPEHVREWNAPEFIGYIESRGLRTVESRLMPADDAPLDAGVEEERRFAAGVAETSPHRCHAVLCRVPKR